MKLIHQRRYRATRLAIVAGSAGVLLMAIGCGPKGAITSPSTMMDGERKLVESTAARPPEWVVREPDSDERYHYFRGFRSDAPSLEGGETDARHNALGHIIQFLGLRVTVDYQRMRTEERTRIHDAIRSVGGADIFGTRLNELYYRRWRVRDTDRIREAYDVYVLIRFPKDAVARIKQGQDERLQAIGRMIPAPSTMGASRDVYSRVIQSAHALTALDDLDQSVLITTATHGQADELRNQATTRLAQMIGRLRLAVATSESRVSPGGQDSPFAVTVRVTTDDRGSRAPASNVPVDITVGDSSRVVWSDDDGIARWPFHHVPFDVGSQSIAARVQLPDAVRTNADFARNVPTANGAFDVVSASSLEVLFVVIDERPGGRQTSERAAEGRLVAALKEQGFQVMSPSALPPESVTGDPWTSEADAIALGLDADATILLRGSMTTDAPTSVAMMRGIYFCRASIELTLTDISNRKVLGSIVLPDDVVRDTRGYDSSPERAASKALMLNRNRARQPNGFTHIAEMVAEMIR
jgi:hypothetical protein